LAVVTNTIRRVSGIREDGAEPARLVFHCYGQACFLSEIWADDAPTGSALSPSEREKELTQSGPGATLATIRLAGRQ
jgi:hypothetical protein